MQLGGRRFRRYSFECQAQVRFRLILHTERQGSHRSALYPNPKLRLLPAPLAPQSSRDADGLLVFRQDAFPPRCRGHPGVRSTLQRETIQAARIGVRSFVTSGIAEQFREGLEKRAGALTRQLDWRAHAVRLFQRLPRQPRQIVALLSGEGCGGGEVRGHSFDPIGERGHRWRCRCALWPLIEALYEPLPRSRRSMQSSVRNTATRSSGPATGSISPERSPTGSSPRHAWESNSR